MESTRTNWIGLMTLVVLLFTTGCWKKDKDIELALEKQGALVTDHLCEAILQSSNKMEAAEWLTRYPKSSAAEDEAGEPILVAPIVSRLQQAGAERVVIEYAKLGEGEFFVALVVSLPKKPASRQRLFAMETELSQLCQQDPVQDFGQKFLYYSFD